MKPRVLTVPWFRSMDEIFSGRVLEELQVDFELVWAKDEPMPATEFADAVRSVDAVLFTAWPEGAAIPDDGRLRALLDVGGTLDHPQTPHPT